MQEYNPLRMQAIRRACTHYVGAEERWKKLAQKNTTDEELVEHLNREFGEGGSGGPGMLPVYQKRNPPRIWIGKDSPEGDPDLSGKKLLAIVRTIFGIHWTPHRDQLALFEEIK